jgi:hypothetical protein
LWESTAEAKIGPKWQGKSRNPLKNLLLRRGWEEGISTGVRTQKIYHTRPPRRGIAVDSYSARQSRAETPWELIEPTVSDRS